MTRLQRGRAILIALAVALVALILTARCEAPGASAASERGQAQAQSSEAASAAHRLPTDAFKRCAVKALRLRYLARHIAQDLLRRLARLAGHSRRLDCGFADHAFQITGA